MTTNPLFVESVEVLKGKLRLSGIPDGKDAEKLLDESILTVRTGFLHRLGSSIVATLRAINFAPDPLTAEEALRALANTTEVRWVYYDLACRMPVILQEGIGTRQVWNEEGAFRQANASEIEKLRTKLWNEIEDALAILANLGVSEDQGMNVTDIGPDEEPQRPADSIRPLLTHEDI